MNKLEHLPSNLPEPLDDGKCDHLLGMEIPNVKLWATDGEQIDLRKLPNNLIIYCYPMTGRPDTELPLGWEEIPGARGCTPQACSFRDHYLELKNLNFEVYGISTQNSDYQKEVAERLHLPYKLLSDYGLKFATDLQLPTFQVEHTQLIKRVTLIFRKGKIVKYFYPVFPPDENINQVIEWLKYNKWH